MAYLNFFGFKLRKDYQYCTYIYVYYVCMYVCMLNINTLGIKKVRGQSEAALQTGATKNFDIG